MKDWGLCGLPCIVAAVVLTWALAGSGYGADATWVHDPNTAGDWLDPNNWSPLPPDANTNALVDNGGTVSITVGDIQTFGLQIGPNYAGSVIQSGGTSTVMTFLHLGSQGLYNLSTGWLTARGQDIGGTFNQSGGTNTAEIYFYEGMEAASSGTYNLSGGSLGTGLAHYVGFYGTGIFNQSGGTNTVPWLIVSGADGTYNLSGGSLGTSGQYVGFGGTGTFNQSGGTNTAMGFILVGTNPGSSGTYNLSGGSFGTWYESVGVTGTGTFHQSGGINTAQGSLSVGDQAGSSGAYNLSGGSLWTAWDQLAGSMGTGTFRQSSGTNTVGGSLYLGYGNNSSGTYTLSGGWLRDQWLTANFFLRYTYSRTIASGLNADGRSGTSNSYDFGINKTFTDRTSGNVTIGYLNSNYDNHGLSNFHGWTARASLTKELNDRNIVDVAVLRGSSLSDFGVNSFFVNNGVDAQFQHLGERYQLTFRGGYQRNLYPEESFLNSIVDGVSIVTVGPA
ncbi:MAG: hypothetical protein ABSH10_05750, partial [Phycisphaerae bacterium]